MHLVYFYLNSYSDRPIAAKVVEGTIEDAPTSTLPKHTSISDTYYLSIARENI